MLLPTAMSRLQKGVLFFTLAVLVFSIARVLLYLSYPAAFSSLDSDYTGMAFINGLRFDGSVVARLFLVPLLLLWLPLKWFDGRWWGALWGWLLYLATLLLALLLVGDIIYFEQVQRHLSYELALLGDDWQFLFAFGAKSYPGAIAGFILFALLLGWLWHTIVTLPTRAAKIAPLKYVGLFLLLVIIGRGGPDGKIIEIIDAYGNGNTAYGNLSLNGAFTTTAFALNLENVDHNFMPQSEAVKLVRNDDVPAYANYPMLRRYAATPSGYNLVFVLLESWNFDYVDSFSGNSHGVTPHFDALAKEGLKFTRFYAAGQRSIDGIQATLTGIPTLKGVPRIDTGIGVSNFSRLGTLVKEKGYSTLFVQSSDRDSFKIRGVAAAAGFEDFYGREDIPLLLDYPQPEGAIFGWDHETLQFMKQKIDGMQPPFLVYAFTGTTHKPYPQLPEQFMRRPNEPDGENGYLNTMVYADWSIGQFMEQARKMPWFDNTIFIFTADHVNNFQRGDMVKRFHTPMLIYAPKIIAAGESHVIGSQLDVVPTIMDLLGIDSEFAALGESLLRKGDEGAAFVSFGGQQIGLITKDGFLRHDLERIMDHQGINEAELAQYEGRLLAMDQLSYELLQANRWAK